MMAVLFVIYLVALYMIVKGEPKIAVMIVLVNIALCLLMFNHHITLKLNLNF